MEARQLFADLTASATPTGMPLAGRSCGGISLPVGGVLSMPNGELFTLTAAAAFKPVCTPVTPPAIIANGGGGSVTIDDSIEGSMPSDDGSWTYSDFQDPFYASTFPQCYALAATTVVAYTLVIMLFVTPRSFLDGGVVVLGQRGFTKGGTGPTIGGRPWLQKIAALTVAISLTIASAATFSVAEDQYSFGVQNAKILQMKVLGGNELKIIRIISNTFLWLAQAQTLIRIFPRQREKVIIKWTAFALITLDVIFQSLNSFQYDQGVARPADFQHAVPALSYLFTLSLGVLYAAWVIYYSLLKKRYAFWHPQMKNMCFIAGLSLLAILIPIVFFILDIVQPDFTGWGDYVRWVGAAAASVIVWEWVERIEALEREEKKDGILGREVFDGDELPDLSNRGLRRRKKADDDGDNEAGVESGRDDSPRARATNKWPSVTAITDRYRPRSRPRKHANPADPTTAAQASHPDRMRFLQPPLWPARPPSTATPVSRTDTASAASTVYAVRYHPPLTETTSRTPPPPQNAALSRSNSTTSSRATENGSPSEGGDAYSQPAQTKPAPPRKPPPSSGRWRALARHIPFQNPGPTDVESATPAAEENVLRKEDGGSGGGGGGSKWDFRERLEDFAATQAERLREKFQTTPDTDSLPVTVIPAPPRRGAVLARVREEEERAAASITDRQNGSISRAVSPGDEPSPAALAAGGTEVVGLRPLPRSLPLAVRDGSGYVGAAGRRSSVPPPVSPLTQGPETAGR